MQIVRWKIKPCKITYQDLMCETVLTLGGGVEDRLYAKGDSNLEKEEEEENGG